MANKRGFLNFRAFSKARETAFKTAQASPAINEPYLGSEPFDLGYAMVTDDDSARGFEETLSQVILATELKASHRQRLTPNGLGLALSFAFGCVSTDGVTPGGGYYAHTFEPRPKTFCVSEVTTTLTVIDTGYISSSLYIFPATGTLVLESDGVTFTYTGRTATTFTGCSAHRAIVAGEAVSLLSSQHVSTLQSTSVVESVDTLKYLYSGVIISRVMMSVERKQPAILEFDMVAADVTTSALSRPTPNAEGFLKAGDATVKTGGTWDGVAYAGGTSINARLVSLAWEFQNHEEGDKAYGFGGGLLRTRAERLGRSQTLKAQLELVDATDLNLLTGQTNVCLQVDFDGPASYGVTMVFPQLRVKVNRFTGGIGVVMQDQEMVVMDNTTYNQASVSVKVVNQTAAYLQ